MDAVKFIREKDRLCGAYVCDDCPLLAKSCDDSEGQFLAMLVIMI